MTTKAPKTKSQKMILTMIFFGEPPLAFACRITSYRKYVRHPATITIAITWSVVIRSYISGSQNSNVYTELRVVKVCPSQSIFSMIDVEYHLSVESICSGIPAAKT